MNLTAPFVLYADASVAYTGRAMSTLERGRYLIIAKADGSISIHAGEAVVPRNYQRPGSSLIIKPGCPLLLESRAAKDTLCVTIYAILGQLRPLNWSVAKTVLTKSETELARKIASELMTFGLTVKREHHTEYGVLDIFAVDHCGCWHVIEVKRNKATLAAVSQLQRYVQNLAAFAPAEVFGYLASPAIGDRARRHLEANGYHWLSASF